MDRLNKRTIEIFEEFSRVFPKGSKKEAKSADFVQDFAERNGLISFRQDGVTDCGTLIHNVVVKKPASEGYESLPAVVLQAHLDMVCVSEKPHNFDKQPLRLIFDKKNNLLRADGTTLGADDGIGVAMILAVLERRDLVHPAIEAVFTSDEECGMSGASNFDVSLLKGKTLINIDSEDEGVFYFGCAGGIYTKSCFDIVTVPPKSKNFYNISVSGLRGGHSGLVIHEGRANANIILGRLLSRLDFAELCDIRGGIFNNAIASEAEAVVGVDDYDRMTALTEEFTQQVLGEYSSIDDGLVVSIKKADRMDAFTSELKKGFIGFLTNVPYGILQMSKNVAGLVQTSNNVGKIEREDGKLLARCFIRSAVGKEKWRVVEEVRQLTKECNGEFVSEVNSPEWEPNPNSPILKLMNDLYFDLFGVYPKHEAIHAGLECGHFSKHYPDMDLISIGPTVKGAHTPKETLYLETLPKVVTLLAKTLERMCSK